MTTAAALTKTRASYGVALVLLPGPVILLGTGRFPGRRARRAARLLGARHLLQAALTAALPQPETLAAGAAADTVHAASMLLLAAVDRRARPAALADALVEGLFAGAGLASLSS